MKERAPLRLLYDQNAETAAKHPGLGAVPTIIWAPLTGAVITLVAGFLGLATHQLWLFPSLAPTAYLYAATPHLPSARLYNTIVGHGIAMGAGFVSVLILGTHHVPSALVTHQLEPVRIWASALAIFFTLLVQVPLRAAHAPAAATALLVSLGLFQPTWSDARIILLGVLITALVGEPLRRIRLAQPGQK
ncbi:MAG: HPP family protein [Bdellovibrionia bacterium]